MMGKWRVALLASALAALMILAAGCGTAIADDGSASSASKSGSASSSTSASASAEGTPDYSQTANWYKIPEITKDVDTFYIYSTQWPGSKDDIPSYASLDNPKMLNGVEREHEVKASVYEDSTNVFMPYYRQASSRTQDDAWHNTGSIDSALSTIPYGDITAALDYYFENYNEGRPFIIAGHSQGSAITRLVLKNYFKEHPEYYKRMVAAYVLGFSITRDDLAADPHLKFATGETDTGVVVSWNTEGIMNVALNANNIAVSKNEISINPLNWKLDDTHAPASENLGSLVKNEDTGAYEIADVGADAQLNLDRGVIVTNANYSPSNATGHFGPHSFHNGDYQLFYNNIKENVAKRIASYKANQ